MKLNPFSLGISPDTTAPAPDAGTEKRKYTVLEIALLPAALVLGILFDRLIFAQLGTFHPYRITLYFFSAIFWLAYLVVFYIIHWEKLRGNKILWLVSGCTAVLCCWNLLFDYRNEYGAITFLVIPAVLMAHAAVLQGGYRLKQVGAIARDWWRGWLIRPFSAIPIGPGALASLVWGERKSNLKKVLIGIAVSLPLLLVIVPLLGSADLVFGYYVNTFLLDLQLDVLILHGFVMVVASMLFYSFLWNTKLGKARQEGTEIARQLDTVICSIVLGILLSVYLLFCAVQFTYLFARTGLPIEMTYSEYAREGFWQLIVITGINLLLFGVLLQYGKKAKVLTAMLAALLGVTAVMLVSSFIRLQLYIGSYGLTWLRLLSAWFILYLAAVLVLCGLRMAKEKIPLVAVCALVLLGWYTTLGYLNPDALIIRYNIANAESPSRWVEENYSYLATLSDNGVLALLDSNIGEDNTARIVSDDRILVTAQYGLSLSSSRARRQIEAGGQQPAGQS